MEVVMEVVTGVVTEVMAISSYYHEEHSMAFRQDCPHLYSLADRLVVFEILKNYGLGLTNKKLQ